MITKTICQMIPVVAMALFVCSCNNNNNNDPTQDGNQVDFVTVKSITNAGTSFEVQKEGDSPVATLITSKKLSEGIKVGQRILLRYFPANGRPYTSGNITPTGYMTIYGSGDPVAVKKSEDVGGFASEDVIIEICQRAGKYVNVAARCFMLNAPKEFDLICDQSTMADAEPVLYLIYKGDSNSIDGAYKVTYGSWDISQIWSLSTCKSIRVKYATTEGTKSVSLIKDASQITPTE